MQHPPLHHTGAVAVTVRAHTRPPLPPQVFIKGITGKTNTIPGMKTTDPVSKLMEQIQAKQGIAPDEQRLLYGSKQLQGHLTLGDYGISQHATIHLVLRLMGGV
jgi:hypothetical protein